MEETLKWLVSTVQEVQQAQQADRQALMTWQADQQRTLQEFIREQSVGVRPRAFAQRLTDWATRWLRPTAQTMEEVMDQIILEQFLLGLPDPVKVWVRRHQPARVVEAVRLTEEYVEAEGPRRGMKPSKGAGSGRSPPDSLSKKGTDPGPTRSRELTCWQCGRPVWMGRKEETKPRMALLLIKTGEDRFTFFKMCFYPPCLLRSLKCHR
uniref:SCAN box domain-containing protein n=1 Tax=Chelydra serpentina TaxID=8475 RepID=A0A8C3TBC3_CHESE